MEHALTTQQSKPKTKELFLNLRDRGAIFTALFLVMNITYQRGFFATLGFQPNALTLITELPLLSNALLAGIAFIAVMALTEMSNESFGFLVGMFQVRTYQDRTIRKNRLWSLVMIGGWGFLSWLLHLAWFELTIRGEFNGGKLAQWAVSLTPTDYILNPIMFWCFFSSGVLLLFVLLILYVRMRARGLRRVEERYLRRLNALHNKWLPFSVSNFALWLVFFLPANAGALEARQNIMAFEQSDKQRVVQMEIASGPACDLNFTQDEGAYYWYDRRDPKTSLHYVGEYSSRILLLKITKRSSLEINQKQPIVFASCLLETRHLLTLNFTNDSIQP